MKKMQFSNVLPVFLLAMIFLAACSGSPESKFLGTWLVEDVQADVDTSQIKPEVLERALDVYRSVSFEFMEGDSMDIVSDGNKHTGEWNYNEEEKTIYIKMDGSRAPELMKFAEYVDGKLINTNNTQIGTIVVTYIKD